ncbi:MAG: hypothetical protein GY856_16655, partial [bacterium]|nr:hypothetical protein [bacterium]
AAENIDLLLGTDDDAPEDIMAKGSAHGYEIARLHRYVPSPEDPDFAGGDVYFSLRTDGYVLEKRALHWRDGESNRGIWKLHSKIKAPQNAHLSAVLPLTIPVRQRVTATMLDRGRGRGRAPTKSQFAQRRAPRNVAAESMEKENHHPLFPKRERGDGR